MSPRALYLTLTMLVVMSVLGSCYDPDPDITPAAQLDVAPQLLMTDDGALAWSPKPRGTRVRVSRVLWGKAETIGFAEAPGGWNCALDGVRFLSVFYDINEDGSRHWQIYLYDMGKSERRLLIDNASFEFFPRPLSPDRKRVLVKWRGEGGGLGVADVDSGKVQVLIPGVETLDATWANNNTVFCACVDESMKSVSIYKFRLGSKPTVVWRKSIRPSGEGPELPLMSQMREKPVPVFRCSPDGEHVAYVEKRASDVRLVCRSIENGGVKQVATDQGIEDSATPFVIDSIVWSRDGKRLCVITNHSQAADLMILNTERKRIRRVALGLPAWHFKVMGWLRSSCTLQLAVANPYSGEHKLWHVDCE